MNQNEADLLVAGLDSVIELITERQDFERSRYDRNLKSIVTEPKAEAKNETILRLMANADGQDTAFSLCLHLLLSHRIDLIQALLRSGCKIERKTEVD